MKWRIMVDTGELADASAFSDEIGLPLSLRIYAEGLALETEDEDAAIMAALAFGAVERIAPAA